MEINSTVNNTKCYQSNTGSIVINSISLTSQEIAQYTPYIIEWTDNIQASQISANARTVKELSAGTYGLRIYGNSQYSDWTYFTVSEPGQLLIDSIKKSNDPCENQASIDIVISGGTPPYNVNYGIKSISSSDTNVTISGVVANTLEYITVTDANLCSVTNNSPTSISFSKINYDIVSTSPPIIYDDHVQDFTIDVKNGNGPYKFIVYESVDSAKGDIVTETDLMDTTYLVNIDLVNNVFRYNLAPIMYPGSYIIDIYDSSNCSITTNTINLNNISPISVFLSTTNNSSINNAFIATTEIIYDTLLIPLHLILQNNDLLSFIQSLHINKKIDIMVGTKKYSQKIISYNKNISQYQNNKIDVLHLGEHSDEWYFTLCLARGFNTDNDPEIFTELVTLDTGSNTYTIAPELSNDSSTIKLIRGTVLTTTGNTSPFYKSSTIGCYENINGEFEQITTTDIYAAQKTYNVYGVGLMLSVNIIDNTATNSLIDLSSPQINFSTDSLSSIVKLKKFISAFNSDKTIQVAAENNISYNGSISARITGGQNTDYSVVYKKYADNMLRDIYYNNQIVTLNSINQLPPGVYLLKISDSVGNKVKLLNSSSYDDHYSASLDYIYNTLNDNPSNLNYVYGDILIIIQDANQVVTNSLPGTETPVQPEDPIDTIESPTSTINQVAVTQNTNYNNSITIRSLSNILYHINGPNNYKYSTRENIVLVNLPAGVYTITGDPKELEANYLYNNTYKIFVSNNLVDYIDLTFSSYLNQFIVKE